MLNIMGTANKITALLITAKPMTVKAIAFHTLPDAIANKTIANIVNFPRCEGSEVKTLGRTNPAILKSRASFRYKMLSE